MIICRKRGFLFLRVPKTASTSLTFLLKETLGDQIDFHTGLGSSKNIDAKTYHMNLKEAVDGNIITEQEIKCLKVYAVLRDPVDRYISIVNTIPHLSRSTMTNEEKVLHFVENKLQGLITLPQSHWLIHNDELISHPIVYPQFSEFLNGEIGRDKLPYTENSENRKDKTSNISSELRERIREMYPEDHVLWERLSRK